MIVKVVLTYDATWRDWVAKTGGVIIKKGHCGFSSLGEVCTGRVRRSNPILLIFYFDALRIA
jgi:hypothetical protein